MVSSEADVLNKNVSCSVIEVVVYIYKYDIILYSIQWQASHGNWSWYAYADKTCIYLNDANH
jgi:hypothetical protein